MKNLPQKFLDKMKLLFENDYNKFVDTYSKPSFCGLRANALKISKEELKSIADFLGDEISWSQDGFYYESTQRPAKSPLYHAGLYYIQEPSAMAVVNNIDIQPKMRVLDICAAPGGKTVNIASKLRGEGLLVSNDINHQRTKAILKNVELYGITNALITNEDHRTLEKMFPNFFDRIILDAPCSGEGMFRKDESLIKSWERSVSETIPVQRELLDACATMLKSGGLMIYSTCTFNEDENEKQILDFLDRHREFKCLDIPKENGLTSRDILPQSARLLPHKLDGEGHFLCMLKKNSSDISKSLTKNIFANKTHFNRDKLPHQYLDFEKENLNIKLGESFPCKTASDIDGSFACKTTSDIDRSFACKTTAGTDGSFACKTTSDIDRSFAVSDGKLYMEAYTDEIVKGFKIVRNGLFVGEIKKEQFIPSQAFIMTLSKDDFKRYIDFDQNDLQIVKYLKGETIFVDGREDGFYGIGVNGYPLGCGRLQNGKLKNGYNKNWRMS